MSEPNQDRYWQRTSTLMWTMLGLWAFFGFVVHMVVGPLNSMRFFWISSWLLYGFAGIADSLRCNAFLVWPGAGPN